MASKGKASDLWKTEDYWAIWLAWATILIALIIFWAGSSIKPIAVSPKEWATLSDVGQHFAATWYWYVALFAAFLGAFVISIRAIGLNLREYIPGFVILFLGSVVVLVVSSWQHAKYYNIESPLVALIGGLIISNMVKLPKWLDTSLRTEYYIKTGIILLGATLPFTLILQAGYVALLQATIVSVTTFLVIYFATTRIAKLEPQFGACMGAGGSVCGVSAAIAVGGAVRAKKEHMAIAISMVVIWATALIIVLPIASRALGLDDGVAGAWIGTSEFADAAGFAAAASIGTDAAVHTYTLMKVLGRDIWIGLWAFILSIIAVLRWERDPQSAQRASAWEIWHRFPKFVIGFFVASAVMTVIALSFDPESFKSILEPQVIGPIKTLRSWTFVFTFLSIGLTTRFRELTAFGWKPFLAFSLGVLVNVPLGYILSTFVFGGHWEAVTGAMMP